MYNDELLERHVVNVLGHIYRKVNWRKMGSRSSYDIFEHRIEYSKYEIDLPKVVQKLCDKLSIQAPVYADGVQDWLESMEYCRRHEKESLNLIRTQGKLLTLLAAERSKEIYNDK